MAQTINTLFAQPFQITSTIQFNRDDQDGSSNRTITDTGYYRVWLAASGTGTEAAPYELLAKLQAALGARYTVLLTSTGLVRISYSGTGTSTLTWTGGANTASNMRSLLGFTGSTTTISAGSYTDSTYQPHGCIFSAAILNSSGVTTSTGGAAFSETEAGVVIGYSSRTSIPKKRFALGWMPRSWNDRSVLTSATATALYPVSFTDIITPRTLYGASTTGAWNVHEFISASGGKLIAVMFGTYQSKIASAVSASDFWTGYVSPETLASAKAEREPIANYPRWMERTFEMNTIGGTL
jgi:hypothetical protein